jgi:hypothetical protein
MILETNQSDIVDLHGIRFFANAITGDFVANKKTLLLLVLLIFWVWNIALLECSILVVKVVSDGLQSQKLCIIIPSVMGQ